ncbi:hypothetical protein HYH02_011743 [Chlamydomonas schloesseri]|uniref:Uncharacterized protein n=1 Tax=Chlamydomonas schloesseri TaxID=2026947 RepID=A0A835W512_9CHLO|nr:hypothetical protein HYH02_011743 [Chlamydomonas schloesseri]|eukprot:KAG2436031.1 hypothetical protein HYH02_011743 [Chlamydomonas schloesseri]
MASAAGEPAFPTLSRLRQAVHRAFRTAKSADGRPQDPGALLSRHLALWLSTSPSKDRLHEPYAALLSEVGNWLHSGDSPGADLWNDPSYSWPRLRVFLTARERGGCFLLLPSPSHGNHDLVQLDTAAVMALAGAEPPTTAAPVRASAAAEGGGNLGAATEEQLEAALASLFLGGAGAAAAAFDNGSGADMDALWCVARMLVKAPPPHVLLFALLGSEVPKRLGRPCKRLRQQCALWPDVFRVELEGKTTYTVQLVCPRLLAISGRQARQPYLPARTGATERQPKSSQGARGEQSGATSAPAARAAAPAPSDASVAELIRAAFPTQLPDGRLAPDQAARRLRQAIAIWLAGSPRLPQLGPRRAAMSSLGHYLRLQQAALWMDPAHKFPKLRTFLESPDSRGVFKVHGTGGRREDAEPIVELDEVALRRVAAAATVQEPGGRLSNSNSSRSSSSAAQQGSLAGPAEAAGLAAAAVFGAISSSSPQQSDLSEAPLEIAQAQSLPAARHPPRTQAAANAAAGIAAVAEEPAQQHLPDAGVCVVADPYGEQLIAMLQHCGCCTRIGLAVQAHAGRPTLVSLYAPPALMQLEGPEGQLVQWPAAVYLVDPLAAAAAYGGGADGDMAAAALLCSLQALLEAPSVAKVVHGGGGGLACLEAAIDAFSSGGGSDGAVTTVACACAYPVHDTRLLLAGVESMLGLPHTPPAPSPQPNGTPPGAYMPGAPYGGGGVALLRGLHGHVARLRDALAGTGLWADRPQLLAALTARHFAALREDMQAAIGSADVNECAVPESLTRPLAPSQVEVAARCARHLPELWAALVQEAVPWVALHVSTAAMAGFRLQQQGGADVVHIVAEHA